MFDVDLLVIGGGCAGLSLALRMAEGAGSIDSVLLLEAREAYSDDRTWCFWRTRSHRFEALVEAQWSSFEVRHGGRTQRLSCEDTPYQMIPSIGFYRHALDRIEASPRVNLDLGVSVTADPEPDGEGWVVHTPGRSIRARYVVDTRPPSVAPDCLLWQSFLGQVVRTGHEAFESGTALLMDFDEPSSRWVRFTYVLPRTAQEALVETTVFATRPLGAEELREVHQMGLERRLGTEDMEVLRSEYGALPMGVTTAADPVPWIRAGLFHGGARPSTGYAFQRIQTWAESCADSLRFGRGPRGPRPDPVVRRWMDTVFLNVLSADPARGPELLFRLFSGAAPARVIRFLSDEGSTLDSLAVVRSLPPSPFLRQAGARLLGRAGGAIR